VHVLSNGTYTVLLTSAGAGYSRWGEFDLTRWRADVTRENTGTWVYVRDQQSGTLWSVGCQPTACGAERENAVFSAHMAEFLRSDFEVSLDMQVTVPPYDDAEIRLVSLTNQAGRPRELTVATYGEVVLAPQASDRRHPAFNKLFIESECPS
jgi:cyclic beta-1,2-glucan synthetase